MTSFFQLCVEGEIDTIESLKALFHKSGFTPLRIEKAQPYQERECFIFTAYLQADPLAQTKIDTFERALWHFQAFQLCHISDAVLTPCDSLPDTIDSARELTYFTIGKTWLIKLGETSRHQPANSQGRHLIRLQQGSAFGTGLHPSTRLMLEQLETLSIQDQRVLDVGTGSGILAIGSAKMGAKQVLGIDIALEAKREVAANLALNPDLPKQVVQVQITALNRISVSVDVVLANLPGIILIQNAAQLSNNLKSQADLILSGYRHEQRQEIDDHFSALGLEKKAETRDNEWISTRWKKTKNQTLGIPDRGRSKQITRRNPF